MGKASKKKDDKAAAAASSTDEQEDIPDDVRAYKVRRAVEVLSFLHVCILFQMLFTTRDV